MPFTIHREKEPEKLIRMGHSPKAIEPEPMTMAAAMPIPEKDPTPPVVQPENKRGRPKKMAKEKKLGHETGVEKIKQEDAGTQGAVGSGGVNAPAQEKVPEKPQGSDKEE